MRIVVLSLLAASLAAAQAPNTLTRAERHAGWQLLFDGHSFAGWVTPPAEAWTVADGCIKTVPHASTREDLLTTAKYRDFEMTWEWKVAAGANSGVKYRVQDVVYITPDKTPHGTSFERMVEYELEHHASTRTSSPRYEQYPIAFEYQMIDSSRHPDALRGGKYQAGALYSMVAPSTRADHPAGEWNQSRLVVRGSHVEHWLNGIKVVDTTLDAPAVRESIEKRWKDAPEVKRLLLEQPVTESPITLQHHIDEAWFRNLKLRRLDSVPH